MATNMFYSGIIHEVLTKDNYTNNYTNWSACLKNYLLSQDLWDIVETEPDQEANLKTWKKKNATALHAIQISCGPDILSQIGKCDSAKEAWDFLNKRKKTQQGESSSGKKNEKYNQYADLLKAVDEGHWQKVKELIKQKHIAYTEKLTAQGDTVLHAAAMAGHEKIVKELVQLMEKEDLESKMKDGSTALAVAAAFGVTQIAACMVQKNPKLLTIEDEDKLIPVVIAADYGHKDLTRYLYNITPKDDLTSGEGQKNGAALLVCCINGEIFDVALNLLERCPPLAFVKDFEDVSPVIELANSPTAFRSGSQFVFWKRWIYSCIRVQLARDSNHHCIIVENASQGQIDQGNILKSVFGQLHRLVSDLLELLGIQQIYERKLMDNQARELLNLICKQISSPASEHDEGANKDDEVTDALFDAAMHGIVAFVKEIIKADPEFLWSIDEDERNIFMHAIVNRQEKIFDLIYAFGKTKKALACNGDKYFNNMLHLAGMLAPSNRLDHVSGAALQMRRELLWFKEVESILPPKDKDRKNGEGRTPREVYIANHSELLKEGEKWMKEMATSCAFAAALIVTITFAAAITIPGGFNGGTGYPVFVERKLFTVFIVADAISFFSSSTSVLIFLGILIARYGEEYFLKSLPTRMILGLTNLFISIATMMITFCTALFLIEYGLSSWIFISTSLLAAFPITLFAWLQFPLLVELIISRYGPDIFDRNTKRWY